MQAEPACAADEHTDNNRHDQQNEQTQDNETNRLQFSSIDHLPRRDTGNCRCFILARGEFSQRARLLFLDVLLVFMDRRDLLREQSLLASQQSREKAVGDADGKANLVIKFLVHVGKMRVAGGLRAQFAVPIATTRPSQSRGKARAWASPCCADGRRPS
jgi:hypothetical protein